MVKTVTIVSTWESTVTVDVDVPDDFEDTGRLLDLPDSILAEMTADAATLIDWEIREDRL